MLMHGQKTIFANICNVGKIAIFTHAFRRVGIFANAMSKWVCRSSANIVCPQKKKLRQKLCPLVSKDLQMFFLLRTFLETTNKTTQSINSKQPWIKVANTKSLTNTTSRSVKSQTSYFKNINYISITFFLTIYETEKLSFWPQNW